MFKFKPILFSVISSVFLFISCTKDTDFPENKVPKVNAGLSLSVTLPIDNVTLSGSASDTDGHVVAYLWSQVSGPFNSNIINPGSPSTKVIGLKQGTYVFQLMATDDKGATGVDTCLVVVNQPPSQTLSLQPSNNPNEFLITNYNGQDLSGTGGPEITIDAWTKQSLPWTLREILKFDLSTIPSNATITSAHLYLYSNPAPYTGNLVDANFGTNNSLFIQQITSSWTPATLGWFNQPSVSSTNQISIPSTSQSFLDLDIDLTNMIGSMINNNTNYGFLIRLQTETTYNSRIFVSSYNTIYPDKKPKLVIVYQ